MGSGGCGSGSYRAAASLGGRIALFLLNFVFAGLIGGCVLVWRLLVAAWYVPLTLYRLLTAGCECIITED
ncbi:MAG: DUF6050 family protein [Acutalibacteraceae bacterium]